jgi:ornithine cyclodeaminase/alanine dehydrogenase-like protein (mu-crystallin family)
MNLCICYRPEEACSIADIICTLTQPKDPVVKNTLINNSVHINAIGSSGSISTEQDSEIIHNSFVVTDNYTTTKNETGDIIIASDKTRNRTNLTDTYCFSLIKSNINKNSKETVFESLGFTAEDIAIALVCYKTYTNKKI